MLLQKNKMRHKIQSKIVFQDDLPKFAHQIAAELHEGEVICLSGSIGAGKTTFSYHLLKALQISNDSQFSSPTFTVLNCYQTKNFLVNHIDLYRLESFDSFEQLDILPYLQEPKTITLVEWGNKFKELEPFYTKKIHFEYIKNHSLERLVQYSGFSSTY